MSNEVGSMKHIDQMTRQIVTLIKQRDKLLTVMEGIAHTAVTAMGAMDESLNDCQGNLEWIENVARDAITTGLKERIE